MTGNDRTFGQVVAQRVQEIRRGRGQDWTQEGLARKLMELDGLEDPSSVNAYRVRVARIESGERKVSVDELVQLAIALGVSPLRLLLPEEDDELIQAAPRLRLEVGLLRQWVDYRLPLRREDVHVYKERSVVFRPATLVGSVEGLAQAAAEKRPNAVSLLERDELRELLSAYHESESITLTDTERATEESAGVPEEVREEWRRVNRARRAMLVDLQRVLEEPQRGGRRAASKKRTDQKEER